MSLEDLIGTLLALDVDKDLPVVIDLRGASFDIGGIRVDQGVVRLDAQTS